MAARTAIIIGAGPAGLTAAYELVHKTDIQPIVYEATGDIGGKRLVVEGGKMIIIGKTQTLDVANEMGICVIGK